MVFDNLGQAQLLCRRVLALKYPFHVIDNYIKALAYTMTYNSEPVNIPSLGWERSNLVDELDAICGC